jgi:hypothetical protein
MKRAFSGARESSKKAEVPGIQTAAESFVADMLADPRFVGKNDSGLSG